MQTQNLKPCNLKIQHMENVNGWCGVRSCFHLLLPAVDAQKKKKESFVYVPSLHQNNFQRAIMCPKSGQWLFYSATYQSTTPTVWGNEFKEFYWNSFVLSMDMDTNPQHPSCNCSLFFVWDGSEMGVNPGSFSWQCLTLRRRQQGRDDNFLKPRIWAGHGGHHWKSFGHS